MKESIRTSKSVNAMTDFQYRCWSYLITYVDDYGRGSADPELLKGFVFPRLKAIRESDISKALAELERIGSIRLYTVDGEPYFCFPNWSEHQRIQTKKSKFPEPPTECNDNSRYSTVNHGEPPPEYESNPNPNTNPNPEYERETREINSRSSSPKKIKYSDFVEMTEEEYEKLIENYGEETVQSYVDDLNNYKGSTGKKYKSDYLTILTWIKRGNAKTGNTYSQSQSEQPTNIFAEILKEMNDSDTYASYANADDT